MHRLCSTRYSHVLNLRVRLPSRGALPDAQERRLHQVLRLVARAEHALGEAQRPAEVALDQAREGAAVAPAPPPPSTRGRARRPPAASSCAIPELQYSNAPAADFLRFGLPGRRKIAARSVEWPHEPSKPSSPSTASAWAPRRASSRPRPPIRAAGSRGRSRSPRRASRVRQARALERGAEGLPALDREPRAGRAPRCRARTMQPPQRTVEGTFREHFGPIMLEEVGARLAAAAATPTPFHERLVWFWANHFTVSAEKALVFAPRRQLRARSDPAARHRALRRHAARLLAAPGDAPVPRQPPVGAQGLAAAPGRAQRRRSRRPRASTRTWRARSWSCTRSA